MGYEEKQTLWILHLKRSFSRWESAGLFVKRVPISSLYPELTLRVETFYTYPKLGHMISVEEPWVGP